MANMVELIKKAAMDAVKASKPANIVYGEVISVSPLNVSVDQRLILDEDFLVLTKNVTSFTAQYTTSAPSSGTAHTHTVEVVIDNSLKIGDKVLMIMAQGGQQYIILDKAVIS